MRPQTLAKVETVMALCIEGKTCAQIAHTMRASQSAVREWIAAAKALAEDRGTPFERKIGRPETKPRLEVERAAPVPMGPWPVIAEEVRVAFGDKVVATRIGVSEDTLRAWCAGGCAPCVKHQAELKRLMATVYARELHVDLMDLEDARDDLIAAGDRRYGRMRRNRGAA